MRYPVRVMVAATAITATVVLAGCTEPVEPTPVPSVSNGADAAQESFVEVNDPPGSLEGAADGLDDISVARCEREGDVWQVAGSVTNPTESEVEYRIYMSLIGDDNRSVALQQLDIDTAAPGVSIEWQMTVPVGGNALRCFPRVERIAL